MKERPIIFSAPMVHAILAGTKTQTRRTVKLPARLWGNWEPTVIDCEGALTSDLRPAKFAAYPIMSNDRTGASIYCPYGVVGDRLWVRETHRPRYFEDGSAGYRADWGSAAADCVPEPKWKPSIFMRRRDSRIILEVTGVRVERLQDISEEDAKAEGVTPGASGVGYIPAQQAAPYVYEYAALWDHINGKRAPWLSNPWVWVVSFARGAS